MSGPTWVDYDAEKRATRLLAQDIAPGRDTRSGRRLLATGTFAEMPESFGFSPDGRKILIEGLPGVTR